jgi:predicted NAD-dependent protein-ADP-ribosyltransferase YbiA (DUF1768 family)
MSVIQFFSRSKMCPPGTGAGEAIAEGDAFPELPINHRQMLSHFWMAAPFTFDDKTFSSIEHGFHYYKVKFVGTQEAADAYTVDGRLGRALPPAVKSSTGKKKLKMTPEQLDTWSTMRPGVLTALARAQYTQNPAMMDMLKATGTAQLMHYSRGHLERFVWLEQLRSEQH